MKSWLFGSSLIWSASLHSLNYLFFGIFGNRDAFVCHKCVSADFTKQYVLVMHIVKINNLLVYVCKLGYTILNSCVCVNSFSNN